MTAPPAWAVELIVATCRHYRIPLPEKITWSQSRRHRDSSGRTWCTPGLDHVARTGRTWRTPDRRQIHVTAGTNLDDQKMVVLHELAHWVLMNRTDPPTGGHPARFWRYAFDLYARHDLTGYATEREWLVGASREVARRGH